MEIVYLIFLMIIEKMFSGIESQQQDCQGEQTLVNDECVCIGNNMNHKPPGCDLEDIDCRYNPGDLCTGDNCLPGYTFNGKVLVNPPLFTCFKL